VRNIEPVSVIQYVSHSEHCPSLIAHESHNTSQRWSARTQRVPSDRVKPLERVGVDGLARARQHAQRRAIILTSSATFEHAQTLTVVTPSSQIHLQISEWHYTRRTHVIATITANATHRIAVGAV
jgi:hypothetical protein